MSIKRRMKLMSPPSRVVTAWVNEKGTICQVDMKVAGYWGSGVTIYGDDGISNAKVVSKVSYPSGGYDSKFEGSNADRTDNFGAALMHAALLMRFIDNGHTVDKLADHLPANMGGGTWMDNEGGWPIEDSEVQS